MKFNPNFSAALIENSEGKFIFELRDNIPIIPHPNKWTLIGGGIEKGENSVDAMLREAWEEIGIKMDKRRLKFLLRRKSKKGVGTFFYYKLYPGEEKNFKFGDEGQEHRFMTLREVALKRNLIPHLRLVLLVFPFLRKKPLPADYKPRT